MADPRSRDEGFLRIGNRCIFDDDDPVHDYDDDYSGKNFDHNSYLNLENHKIPSGLIASASQDSLAINQTNHNAFTSNKVSSNATNVIPNRFTRSTPKKRMRASSFHNSFDDMSSPLFKVIRFLHNDDENATRQDSMNNNEDIIDPTIHLSNDEHMTMEDEQAASITLPYSAILDEGRPVNDNDVSTGKDNQNLEGKSSGTQNKVDNHELARDKKKKLNQNVFIPKVVDDKQDYDAAITGKKNLSFGQYIYDRELILVTQIRGNFWKIFGFHENRRDYLHDEEALILIEKSILIVNDENGVRIPLRQFYELTLQHIDIACYLTYTKLKSLEYIVFRHNHQKPRCIDSIEEVDGIHKQLSSGSLLEEVIGFDVFLRTPNWSKRQMIDSKPLSYVIITTCEEMFPPHIMLRLLEESGGIPLLISVVSRKSYNVMLEEFSDAHTVFDWCNDLAIENALDFDSPCTVNEQLTKYNDEKRKAHLATLKASSNATAEVPTDTAADNAEDMTDEKVLEEDDGPLTISNGEVSDEVFLNAEDNSENDHPVEDVKISEGEVVYDLSVEKDVTE